MNRHLIALPLLLGLATPALVAAGQDEATAAARYAAVLDAHRKAPALDLSAAIDLTVSFLGEESAQRAQIEMHAMHPAAGSMRVEFSEDPVEGEEAVPADVSEYLGDGTSIYQLDREEKVFRNVGSQWFNELGLVSPLVAWCGREDESMLTPILSVAFAEKSTPERTGLRIVRTMADPDAPESKDAPTMTEPLWVDAKNRVVGGKIELAQEGISFTATLTVTKWELPAAPALADYVRQLPEGFTEGTASDDEDVMGSDFEAQLLPVGAEAPAVTMTGMDDLELTLASLKGEPVLLNFWFYH